MSILSVTDRAVEGAVNGLRSVWAHDLFWVLSVSVIVAAAAVFFYFMFVLKDTRKSAILLCVYGLLYILTELIKIFTDRVRPNGDLFSFPSRHAAFAFFIAYAYPTSKRWKVVLYIWAALVGLSRIALAMHWLSDVIFGAGIGLLLGFGFEYVTTHLKN